MPRLLGGPVYRKIWETPFGEIAEFPAVPLRPDTNSLRFTGDVFLLINEGTFSSATMLAATIKDYELGTLVGEETGGLASNFGEVYSFALPNTRLVATVSCKRSYDQTNGLTIVA